MCVSLVVAGQVRRSRSLGLESRPFAHHLHRLPLGLLATLRLLIDGA